MSGTRTGAGDARVSSDQQAKSGTIESQIASLRERIADDGEQIADEMLFIDAGVSGATLVRPQLERLRDHAAFGLMDRLYVLSPDRLSRKYAHQVLLMEELAGCGVDVVFLNHAVGTSPQEEMTPKGISIKAISVQRSNTLLMRWPNIVICKAACCIVNAPFGKARSPHLPT